MNEQKASEVLALVKEMCVTHTIEEVVNILSSEWERCYKKIAGTFNHVYLKSKCFANTRLLLHKGDYGTSVYISIVPNHWQSSF